MLKSAVLAHYDGNGAAVARAVGVTRSAVCQWPDDDEGHIPEAMAYRVQAATRGKLKVDPADYRRSDSAKSA